MPRQSFVSLGGSVTFSLTNTLNVPSTYQWQFNGTNIANATNATLALSSLTLDLSGSYSAIVSNEYEVVTSTSGAVQVVDQVIITQQPASTNTPAGSNVTFSVSAVSPLPITYRWQFNGLDLPGQTSSTLALNNVQLAQDGLYRVVVTNAAASTLTINATASLTVLPDTDGDGLPDAWETAHDLDLNDTADAALDSDSDGLSNLAEYRSGTNPTNAASLLKLDGVSHANGQAQVTFNDASNQTYTVEWRAQMPNGTWSKVADVLARTNNRMESVTDGTASDRARFYRVVTPRRP